jgi:endoglucanase
MQAKIPRPPGNVSQTIDLPLTRRSLIGAGLAIAGGGLGCASPYAHASSERPLFAGVNLAGGEFGNLLGTQGTDYRYPAPADIDYYAELGFNLIRVPFRWERLQPKLGAPFVSADQEPLTQVVEYATGKGLHVVLDTHNYARRRLADDGWTADHPIGSKLVPIAAFTDYCGRLAGIFKGARSVIFGLMNEPWGIEPEDWLVIANAAIAAFRREGARQLVLVPGVAYSGAHSWVSALNIVMGNIVDPANKFAFEVHQYLDADSSGTSSIAVGASIGSERIEAFQRWCRQNSFRAFLGEFGAGADATSLAALDDICRTLEVNSDVWLGWAAWAGGSWWPDDYIFTLEPSRGKQMRPQTRILASYARRTASQSNRT